MTLFRKSLNKQLDLRFGKLVLKQRTYCAAKRLDGPWLRSLELSQFGKDDGDAFLWRFTV